MKRLLSIGLASVLLVTTLGGCVVVPAPGYYHHHGYYYGHGYYRYR